MHMTLNRGELYRRKTIFLDDFPIFFYPNETWTHPPTSNFFGFLEFFNFAKPLRSKIRFTLTLILSIFLCETRTLNNTIAEDQCNANGALHALFHVSYNAKVINQALCNKTQAVDGRFEDLYRLLRKGTCNCLGMLEDQTASGKIYCKDVSKAIESMER